MTYDDSDDSDDEEEKTSVRIDNDPDNKIRKVKKKISKNPWMIVSLVLAAVVIILLFMVFRGGITGNVVSGNDAGDKIVEFLNGRTGGGVAFVSYEDIGNLYEVTVSYDGQNIPVFVTKDGEYFVQGAIPITGQAIDGEANNTQQQQEPQDVPKSDKPKVEVFVMSHCPYGTQIEKGVIPVFELLGDKIEGSIKFVNYAMHGETEVMEELRQYCIQEEQNDKYMDYLKCFLEASDSDSCLDKVKINKAKLNTCEDKTDKEFKITENLNDKSTWSSGSFPPFLVFDNENKQYGVQGSPTLIINGQEVSSGRDSASLLSAVCNAFNEAPEECSETLSSASPSPGFGYSASASASTSGAQCG